MPAANDPFYRSRFRLTQHPPGSRDIQLFQSLSFHNLFFTKDHPLSTSILISSSCQMVAAILPPPAHQLRWNLILHPEDLAQLAALAF
jgi:hypothetical protein